MATGSEPLLKVRGLCKSFAGPENPAGPAAAAQRLLDLVSLDLAAGETLALRGESGSGKSTLLHVIGALEPADAGSVRLAGTELVGLSEPAAARIRREVVGLVFQQFNLIPSLTVAENIGFHARLAGRSADIAGLAERLGIAAQLERYPETLSGGQQQRAAIARVLAMRPALILADEPTGNLDEETGDRVLEVLLEEAAAAGAALLMVTHSTRLAARLGRELVLARGRLSAPAGPQAEPQPEPQADTLAQTRAITLASTLASTLAAPRGGSQTEAPADRASGRASGNAAGSGAGTGAGTSVGPAAGKPR